MAGARLGDGCRAGPQLYISAKTVQYHLTRIYGKLGIRSRSELAARYRESGTIAGEGDLRDSSAPDSDRERINADESGHSAS
nr:LuxR C-terminal-related transcriptional regulator [Microbacterium sp. NFH-22A-Y]